MLRPEKQNIILFYFYFQLVRVKYNEGKTKLSDYKLTAEGCMYCDPELSKLVEKHHAVMTRRRVGGGGGPAGRGGKRGGGAGPGGKAKRKKPPKDKMSQLAAYFV
jgi:DNA topoisomerase-3